MSKVMESSPRIRDDSQVRALALGSKACKDINLSAMSVDWERFLDNVAQEYDQGRAEWEIDWKRTVRMCAVRTASSDPESWFARLSKSFQVSRLPSLAFRLAVIMVLLWLVFFRRGENARDMGSEFRALQQDTRLLKEENEKLHAEVQKAAISSEKAREDLVNRQKDLEQKIAQLEQENRSLARNSVAKRESSSKEQLALVEPPNLLSDLETTGKVAPTEATRIALRILDSRDTRDTLRSARSEQNPIPLSPRFTAIRVTTPTLRWEGVTAEQYRVRVVYGEPKANDRLVWDSGVVRETQAALPSGLLLPGRVYFWQVEALVDGKSRLSPAVGFWVISQSALRRVEATERNYRDSALMLAAMYESQGLYEEALAQVDKLSSKNKSMANLAQDMRKRLRHQLEKD